MATRFDDISSGKTPGVTPLTKFGRNPDVDSGTEDIWTVGGTWIEPSAAAVVTVVSTSLLDTLLGTGVRTVLINGLNENYALVSETLSLNGILPVTSVTKFLMVHRVLALTAGILETNAGAISVISTAPGLSAMAQMMPGLGQSQFSHFQVPAGVTAYMLSFHSSFMGSNQSSVDVRVMSKPFGGIFSFKAQLLLSMSGSSIGHRQYDAPLVFTEKTIIKMTCTATSNNNDVSGSYDLMLVTN